MSALSTLSSELAAAVERAAASVVTVHARRRVPSTGICWADGIVVTADHTVRMDDDITVTLPDGATTTATIAGRDPGTDVAVLRVADARAVSASRGDPAALRLGQLVLALGPGPTVSGGVVSRLGAGWRTGQGAEIDRLIQPDLVFYPGFSGGPLVDVEGRVTGMNTSGLSRQLRLTIPITTVQRVADELVRSGRVRRGYLGVAMQPVRLPEALRQRLDVEAETGVIVLGVETGSPAAKAGIVMGDVLLALGGTPTRDPSEVRAILGSDRVGTAMAVTLVRAGERMSLEVTVEERPRR
jgi:S1-C subfamily serine protease